MTVAIFLTITSSFLPTHKDINKTVLKSITEILDSYSDRIIATRSIAERKPCYVPIPDFCREDLRNCLLKLGREKLYSHQAELFENAISGKNCVITTGTASGKSLAFYLPVLQRILENPSRRALFLYPTKALAQDQRSVMEEFAAFFGPSKLKVGVYDGDTPPSERRRIREEANIILTNPDMLNASFLPNHNRFGFPYLFQNLSFVVLDELHSYRSAFGAHVSNVIRRLLRICRYHSNTPVFLCSSATIANPRELAENICHSDFIHIERDGSPASPKELIYWLPCNFARKGNEEWRRSTSEEMAELLPQLVENDIRTIAFCQSRKATEIVTKECRDTLSGHGAGVSLASRISGYRGGYTPEERRRIEAGLANGEISVVVSTNALELGIDIGSLQMVILGGYPGTRASFWQQVGRAGRRNENAYAVLMLGGSPVDEFISVNPDWILQAPIENAVIDKNNLFIQLSHVRAASGELPLTIDDTGWFPDLGEIVPVLQEIGELDERNGVFHWIGQVSPAQEISLRSITNEQVEIIDHLNNRTLTSIDIKAAKREVYPGAIYLHDTIQYKCLSLNLEKKIATVETIDSDHFTEPWSVDDVEILLERYNKPFGRTSAHFGDVKVTSVVIAYKKIHFVTRDNVGFDTLEEPLLDELDTEACWIILSDNVGKIISQMQNMDGPRDKDISTGIIRAVKSMAEIRVMATYSDVGGSIFGIQPVSNGSSVKALILYDQYPGGLGFTEKIIVQIEDIVRDAISFVKNCRCEAGCPICVGSRKINKFHVIWALQNLFAESTPPVSISVPTGPIPSTRRPKYAWSDVQVKWPEIIETFSEHHVTGGMFLLNSGITELQENTIVISVSKAFLEIANRPEMKAKMESAFVFYVDVPEDFSLVFVEKKDAESEYKRQKMSRFLKQKEQ